MVANKEIKITIAIAIGKDRTRVGADIAASEGIGDGSGVGGGKGAWCRDVFEIDDIACLVANKEIKITITISIGKGRLGESADRGDAEGIGDGSGVGGNRAAWGRCVFKIENITVIITNEEIKITVFIGIGKDRVGVGVVADAVNA